MKRLLLASATAISAGGAAASAHDVFGGLRDAISTALVLDHVERMESVPAYLGITPEVGTALGFVCETGRDDRTVAFLNEMTQSAPLASGDPRRIIDEFNGKMTRLYEVEEQGFARHGIDIVAFCEALDDSVANYANLGLRYGETHVEEVMDAATATMLRDDVAVLSTLPISADVPAFEVSVEAWRASGFTVPSW